MTGIDALWIFVDLIFPCTQPRPASDLEKEAGIIKAMRDDYQERVAQLPQDSSALREYLASCNGLLTAESDRRSGVESRLGSIVGLSSIAGSIVFGTLLNANPRQFDGWLKWVFAVGLLYLTLQICSAISAAVAGLKRRGYMVPTPGDILPAVDTEMTAHLRGQISGCLEILDNHRELNNQKVTEMAIAHRALLNFVGGLFALAIFATWASVSAKPPSDDLLQKLRESPTVRELLRGPQGPAGPQGPPGPPAVTPKHGVGRRTR